MPEAILCSHCNKPIASSEAYTCSQCGKFFCDSCTIQKNEKFFCVSCFSSGLSKNARKVLDQILARKGVKIEVPKLVFRGMQIRELSGVKVDKDKQEFKVKCINKEEKTFIIDKKTFDELWEKAQELGYKTERIPFGLRIVV
jgi:hypothetical protein